VKYITKLLKLLSIFIIIMLFSTTAYATQYSSNWGTAPWTWAAGTQSKTIMISPSLNVNISFTFNGAAPTAYNGYDQPYLDDASSLALFGGIPDLGVIYDDPASITAVMTFSKPVYNASFLATDIDNSNQRVDQVVATTDNGDPTLVDVNTGAGDTIDSISGNTASSALGRGNSANDDLGSVLIEVPDGATTITLQYNEIGQYATRGVGLFGGLTFSDGGNISGHLYNDTNGNGTQDAGESDLVGVDVVITASNGQVQTVTTDANGDYLATAVAPGNATVDINDTTLPAGVVQTEGTDPTTVMVNVDVNNTEENNGFHVSLPPVAADDNTSGVSGQPATLTTLSNDTDPENDINASSVNITTAGATDTDGEGDNDSLVIPGEGAWTVDNGTGAITFTTEAGFTGDPTPVYSTHQTRQTKA